MLFNFRLGDRDYSMDLSPAFNPIKYLTKKRYLLNE